MRGEPRLKLASWAAELFGQLLKMMSFMPAGFCLGVPAQDGAGWSHAGNPLTENIRGWGVLLETARGSDSLGGLQEFH